MKVNVNDVHIYQSSASLDNVINQLNFYFEISGSRTNGGINTVRRWYTFECEPVTSASFTPYTDLTSQTVQGWVQSSYGSNWGSFTSSVETLLNEKLTAHQNSDFPLTDISWESGSFITNGNLTQIYFTTSPHLQADWGENDPWL
tara:strand:- start:453 stop:887 length:435 start_codon:yes stop_codon:yes gene_type:complete